jgi:hypothetical protein
MFLASALSEHLSNPEYLRVLLNPLPVYELAVGVLGLLSPVRAAAERQSEHHHHDEEHDHY